MAYKRGDPLLRRNAMFLIASKAVSWLVEIIGWPLMRLLYGFRVHGRENLKASGLSARQKGRAPHIVVSNHSLPLDPLLHALSIQPRFTYFTLLEETVLTPVLGTLVRLLGGIPVPHDPGRLDDIEKAVEEGLRERGIVHFYPEGECFLLSQEIRPFKAGAFFYAIKFGIPVIPVVTVIHARAGRASLTARDAGIAGRHSSAGGPGVVAAPNDSPIGTPAGNSGFRKAPRIIASTHILPAIAPPPPSGRAAADLHNAILFSRIVRTEMQARIDSLGGDKNLCRGPMPRIKGVNDRNRETRYV